jgi:caffeoyl-CoA O-methyltransferase
MLTLSKPGIEEYAVSKTQDPAPLLDELMRETYESVQMPQMLTGPIEGTFLRTMVAATGAKNVLEIGMFTGYSALSMASALPADGKLITLEINPIVIAVAKKYFARSEHGKKIEIREGSALDSLKQLSGPFDLVFIDADKTNYSNYYEAVLPKVRQGGVILVDNVLWGGRVLEPTEQDDKAICAFNDLVSKDERVDRVLLTIRDGVFFIRKR